MASSSSSFAGSRDLQLILQFFSDRTLSDPEARKRDVERAFLGHSKDKDVITATAQHCIENNSQDQFGHTLFYYADIFNRRDIIDAYINYLDQQAKSVKERKGTSEWRICALRYAIVEIEGLLSLYAREMKASRPSLDDLPAVEIVESEVKEISSPEEWNLYTQYILKRYGDSRDNATIDQNLVSVLLRLDPGDSGDKLLKAYRMLSKMKEQQQVFLKNILSHSDARIIFLGKINSAEELFFLYEHYPAEDDESKKIKNYILNRFNELPFSQILPFIQMHYVEEAQRKFIDKCFDKAMSDIFEKNSGGPFSGLLSVSSERERQLPQERNAGVTKRIFEKIAEWQQLDMPIGKSAAAEAKSDNSDGGEVKGEAVVLPLLTQKKRNLMMEIFYAAIDVDLSEVIGLLMTKYQVLPAEDIAFSNSSNSYDNLLERALKKKAWQVAKILFDAGYRVQYETVKASFSRIVEQPGLEDLWKWMVSQVTGLEYFWKWGVSQATQKLAVEVRAIFREMLNPVTSMSMQAHRQLVPHLIANGLTLQDAIMSLYCYSAASGGNDSTPNRYTRDEILGYLRQILHPQQEFSGDNLGNTLNFLVHDTIGIINKYMVDTDEELLYKYDLLLFVTRARDENQKPSYPCYYSAYFTFNSNNTLGIIDIINNDESFTFTVKEVLDVLSKSINARVISEEQLSVALKNMQAQTSMLRPDLWNAVIDSRNSLALKGHAGAAAAMFSSPPSSSAAAAESDEKLENYKLALAKNPSAPRNK